MFELSFIKINRYSLIERSVYWNTLRHSNGLNGVIKTTVKIITLIPGIGKEIATYVPCVTTYMFVITV